MNNSFVVFLKEWEIDVVKAVVVRTNDFGLLFKQYNSFYCFPHFRIFS